MTTIGTLNLGHSIFVSNLSEGSASRRLSGWPPLRVPCVRAYLRCQQTYGRTYSLSVTGDATNFSVKSTNLFCPVALESSSLECIPFER